MTYDPARIENFWQQKWNETKLHQTDETSNKPKFYCLEQFPYPSGNLHMGHMRVYSIGDVIARFQRMKGFNVLHPMGWDAFGLPAENAAIKSAQHPKDWTYSNISTMKQHQEKIGVSIDWTKEVTTCSPAYYKFNQWLFLHMYEKGFAYRKKAPVNWCDDCNTVLANEQVEDGKCWRCKSVVTKKELEQWFFKITNYAERLLNDLEKLPEWDDRVKTMQKNWIGKTKGYEIDFDVPSTNQQLTVFTTRPDTIYRVNFIAIAPEHPFVSAINKTPEITSFIDRMKRMSEIERSSTKLGKEGVFTGLYAKHPLLDQHIPIYLANYVLPGYGTGAVMGVPSKDERDKEFAEILNIPQFYLTCVANERQPWDWHEGNSKIDRMMNYFEEKAIGRKVTNYRLRDWLVSRQRYWGTPIPIVYCDACGAVPVEKASLPIVLPQDVVFDGKNNPIATNVEFVHTTCPSCGGAAKRETDTMDTFMDSSWYFLRFTDPHNTDVPFSPEKANKWMQVDEYVGGIEHAILHLLYARFFTKVLYDAGMVDNDEPFAKLLAQGMVLKDGKKMSKSLGNVVSPEDIINTYGADTCRLFILFAAPPEKDLEWVDDSVAGCFHFLNRVYQLAKDLSNVAQADIAHGVSDEELSVKLHQTIKKVTEDFEKRKFNTAISSIMELVNMMIVKKESYNVVLFEAINAVIHLLAPFVPHITEEMWKMFNHHTSIHNESWISYDVAKLELDEVEILIQINNKKFGYLKVKTGDSEVTIKDKAIFMIKESNGKVQIKKHFYIAKKLINFVI